MPSRTIFSNSTVLFRFTIAFRNRSRREISYKKRYLADDLNWYINRHMYNKVDVAVHAE